jgi:superfamily I DNA/RNA helicase
VVIGTIHSVKGGQADVVYLVPDLSGRGASEWAQPGARQDGVRRQMYVGMTRARRELAVCNPATTKFVTPESMVAGARRNAS